MSMPMSNTAEENALILQDMMAVASAKQNGTAPVASLPAIQTPNQSHHLLNTKQTKQLKSASNIDRRQTVAGDNVERGVSPSK